MGEELEVLDVRPMEPRRDLENGVAAANVLLELVKKTGLSKSFGGAKEHLYYEAWQMIAKFFGYKVETRDTEPVDIDGVKGVKAVAQLIDESTGCVVGGAEAYCMRDERNWKDKPFFQLASMAQTRAGSKCVRNAFAYVPALAGFSPTPAEEMDTEYEPPKEKEKPKKKDGPKEFKAEAIRVEQVAFIKRVIVNKGRKPYDWLIEMGVEVDDPDNLTAEQIQVVFGKFKEIGWIK